MHKIRSYKPRRYRRRSAAVTLEFILTLPIIIMLTWGVFQYAILFLVQNAVTHSAIVGAREAGKHEDIREVAWAVDQVLQEAHCVDVVDDHGRPIPGSGVRICMEVGDPHRSYPRIYEFGDPGQPCNIPSYPRVGPDEVRVTICMDLTRSPLTNFLFNFGITELSFEGKRFQISSLVKKE